MLFVTTLWQRACQRIMASDAKRILLRHNARRVWASNVETFSRESPHLERIYAREPREAAIHRSIAQSRFPIASNIKSPNLVISFDDRASRLTQKRNISVRESENERANAQPRDCPPL